MFTIACCIGVGLGLGLGLGLDLMSGFARVFVLLSTVIVTLPDVGMGQFGNTFVFTVVLLGNCTCSACVCVFRVQGVGY